MAENFPPDLVDLQRGFQAAHQRILDFLAERQGAAWTAEDDEELARNWSRTYTATRSSGVIAGLRCLWPRAALSAGASRRSQR